MKRTNRAAVAAVFAAAALFSIESRAAAQAVDWQAVAAQVTSNIAARIAVAIGAKTNAVRALATPENYALLKSSKLKDAAAKLALQKKLAEAALLDEEQTEAGRLKWHGRYTGQKIDMDALTITFIHADGTEYTVKFQRPNIQDQIAKANAKLQQPPMTNGIPRALAAARLKRYEEKLNPTKTVTVETNATGGTRPQGGAR